MSDITPSQTIGPFFAYGLTPHAYDWNEIITGNTVTADATGERIAIEGTVYDGDNVPVPDAMIEIWQADAEGRYAHPRDPRAAKNASFKGFGRSDTDKNGVFRFETIRPGAVPGPDGKPQAPHIGVIVFMRGILMHVYTRIYFEDEKANAADLVLSKVPAERRGTLIAKKALKDGKAVYRFDVHMQGDKETVFFDI